MARVLRELPRATGNGLERASALRLDLTPEAVDAGVPLLRNLLEGLVSLLPDLESGAGDELGHRAAERWARGRVAAAGEHERRGGDLRQALGRVVVEERVEVGLEVFGRLLVGEGEHLLNERFDGPVVMRACGVDVKEETLEKGALARGDLDEPA